MKSLFYMLKLRVCGIKNIERPVEINFYKKTINNDFDPEKHRIKAIYGENGSGKTAIIQSVKILQNLLIDKSYLADNDTQRSLVEIVNKKIGKGFIETEFYTNLEDEKYIFRYYVSFTVKDDERIYITEEHLEQKNGKYSKNSYSTVFHTQGGGLLEFGDPEMYEFFKDKTQNLLDKQTFATCLIDRRDIPQKYRTNEQFLFQMILFIFAMSLSISIDAEDSHASYVMRKKINEIDETSIENFGMDFINQVKEKVLTSRGDERLIPKKIYASYEEQVRRLCEFVKIFKPELVDIEIEKKDYDQFYKCNLKMVYEDYTLDKEFESRGIKKMMDLFNYLNTASNGGIVFIDELDSNINDVYLDKIIEYFVYYGRGQLCFTSHNLSPMTVLKRNKNAINFISSINTVHTWTKKGNLSPENAYKNGFIEDSPFNVDPSDFLGILGGDDE
mgnify:CR=1 FL=1